ncbi:uncharacterized protein DMAD_08020 [Drosophila madeirensis]|uniref:Uncharacterized protein n=1 Tax=Drosophila madeirensis TaxID=30013 RepID=A0AAU9EU13_DROMD
MNWKTWGSERSLPENIVTTANLLDMFRLHPGVPVVQGEGTWAEAPLQWRLDSWDRRLPVELISDITVYRRNPTARLGVRRLEVYDGRAFRVKINRRRQVTVTLRTPRTPEYPRRQEERRTSDPGQEI